MPVVAKKPASKKAAPSKKSAKSVVKKSKKEEEALYPEVTVSICHGDEAITEETAKSLLGWQELPDDSDLEPMLKDNNGKGIICLNNRINRQLYGAIVSQLCQEILQGNWVLNGETIIIGKNGRILNGQHELIALIMACHIYDADPEGYPYWNDRQERPFIEKLVVFGIEETDRVVNTMDTGKGRSMSDVFFRSEYFRDETIAQKKILSRILDYAIRLLWYRTGASVDAYAPRRTHAEAEKFLERHLTLLDCVRYIAEADEEKGISKMISPGTAAGLMYLMVTSNADATEYHSSETPHEGLLDLEMKDKAEEYWTAVSEASKITEPMRKVIGSMYEEEGGGSSQEKMAVIVKGWRAFAENDSIKESDLKLKYHKDDDGYKTLAECPVTGGIDLGNPTDKEDATDISPEEIKRRAQAEKDKTLASQSDDNKAAKKASKAAGGKKFKEAKSSAKEDTSGQIEPKTFVDNEVLIITDPDTGERWKGLYVDHQAHPSRGVYVKIKVGRGYAGAGKIMDVNIKHISRS